MGGYIHFNLSNSTMQNLRIAGIKAPLGQVMWSLQ